MAFSPRNEHPFPTYAPNPLSPQRNSNRLSGGMMHSVAESRSGLQRRFTTNALPTLSPIGQQRLQAAGEVKQPNRLSTLAPSEQKSRFYESLLAEQRRIQAYIEQIDPETRREVDQNLRHESAVSHLLAQSEPTTPPEYADAFASAYSKPNRYSTTSLSSSAALSNRTSRASTQLTSPPMALNRLYNGNSNHPSQSVPASRRQSDDEEDVDEFLPAYDMNANYANANPNRKSLPVTRNDRKRANVTDLPGVLGPVNTTAFLFDDEDKPAAAGAKATHTSPSDGKTYLQVQHTADGFPKLIRREENGATFLAEPAAALDLAFSKHDQQRARHRISLPPTSLRNNEANIAGIGGILINSNDKIAPHSRRSVEVRPALKTTPPRTITNGNMQVSYSTNDVPTLKSVNGTVTSPPLRASDIANAAAHLNGSAHSRVTSATSYTTSNRQSQDFSTLSKTSEIGSGLNSPESNSASALQGGAMPFGPTGEGIGQDNNPLNFSGVSSPAMSPYAQPAFYGGYGMQMLANGFSNMSFNGGHAGPWPNQPYNQSSFNGYPQFPSNGQAVAGAPRFSNETPRGAAQPRRVQQDDTLAKINAISIDQLKGDIHSLCVDQHGCRFLQRKLDEHDAHTTQVIFDEVRPHIVKLMVDPFGNYLCQKLLENCTDEQRSELIKNAMAHMAEIALNQHGTRALQKMIEHITTPEQTELIIDALRYKVVLLIQDLNGNHVIQKCLNHLKSRDAQFIFDAVGANCVTVGTHRHGCCVLQRCIDHAAGFQKGELVRQITMHAMTLIQDPFGNYVVQYILDIGEPSFTEPLCKAFLGNIAHLSKQKFSSNVIEKCIRCAGPEAKRLIIREISPSADLESLLRDSYANYVVQTAIDYAEEDLKLLLIGNLRPLLTSIRHTPYGRRIQSKINEYDGSASGAPSATESLNAGASTTSPPAALPQYGTYTAPNTRANRMGFVGAPPAWSINSNQNSASAGGPMPGFTNAVGAYPQNQPALGGFNSMHSSQHTFQTQAGNGFHAPGVNGSRPGQTAARFF